jgi:hypothetical protein
MTRVKNAFNSGKLPVMSLLLACPGNTLALDHQRKEQHRVPVLANMRSWDYCLAAIRKPPFVWQNRLPGMLR